MTVFDFFEDLYEEKNIELTTKDNVIINLKIEDLIFFSKYPQSTLWLIYKEDGFLHFKNFIKTNITYSVFEAIIYFYNYDKWPNAIKIDNIFDPYIFLNLPTFDECNDSDDDFEENSSDGY